MAQWGLNMAPRWLLSAFTRCWTQVVPKSLRTILPPFPPSFLPPGFGKGFGKQRHASILPLCFEFLFMSTKFGSFCLLSRVLFSVNDIHAVFLSSPIAKALRLSSALVSCPGFLSHATENVAPSHLPGVKSSRTCRQRRSRREAFEKGCTLL